MNFRQATDLLGKAGVRLQDVAAAFDVTPNTVSRWRRVEPSGSRNAFNPPADWPETLRKLTKQQIRASQTNAARLQELLLRLEAE